MQFALPTVPAIPMTSDAMQDYLAGPSDPLVSAANGVYQQMASAAELPDGSYNAAAANQLFFFRNQETH